MFRQLLEDLRARSPLARAQSEVGRLLSENAPDWPGPEVLLCRPAAYTRTKVYRDADFELILLNWAPGAASAIHDHGGQHCWMVVLDGSLEVDDYVRLDPGEIPGVAYVEARGSRTLGPGEMDLRSGPFDLHRVSAPQTKAVSLHLYAGPLVEFLVYDPPGHRYDRAYGMYDAVVLDDRRVAESRSPGCNPSWARPL